MRKKLKLKKEQITISNKQRQLAREYFGIVGTGLVLHHTDQSLRKNDIDRYIQWNPEDLKVMTNEEHARLHMTGYKVSEECKIAHQISNSKYPVRCIETGNEYISAQDAARQLCIKASSNIYRACKINNYTAGGFHWERV